MEVVVKRAGKIEHFRGEGEPVGGGGVPPAASPDARRRAGRRSSAGLSGAARDADLEHRAPSGWLWALMLPSWAADDLAGDRSPEPAAGAGLGGAALTNLSKICCSSPVGIPTPWSRTLKATASRLPSMQSR